VQSSTYKPDAKESPSKGRKEIQQYCDRILEEVEEEISSLILQDEMPDDREALGDVLCKTLTKDCRTKKDAARDKKKQKKSKEDL